MRHGYVVRKHNGYTGAVVVKYIAGIYIVIGKHKVNTIAYVMGADITAYSGLGYKFKIQSIAVALYIVIFNKGMAALPHMDAVARSLFGFG
jgi:hypothetical protein